VTDPSADVTDYDAVHTITVDVDSLGDPLAEELSSTRQYYAIFRGEAGTNAQVNTLLMSLIRVNIEVTP